jgi:large conductance mechanosensitive channel
MLKGFKDFLLRGNIVDLATAVVVGTAFAALVKAFGDTFVTPLLNAIPHGQVGSGLSFSLRHATPELRESTRVDLGILLNAVVVFVITAAVVYFVFIVPMNRLAERRKHGAEPEPKAPSEEVLLLQEIRDLLRDQARPASIRRD